MAFGGLGTLLRAGSTGSDVSSMQTALNALGYNLTVNGNFDTATTAAVMHFQSTNGLTVDGIIGPETMSAIEDALSGQPITPAPVKAVAVAVKPTIPTASYVPPVAAKPAVTSLTGGTPYAQYALYGAIGLVGILVLLKITKKKA